MAERGHHALRAFNILTDDINSNSIQWRTMNQLAEKPSNHSDHVNLLPPLPSLLSFLPFSIRLHAATIQTLSIQFLILLILPLSS